MSKTSSNPFQASAFRVPVKNGFVTLPEFSTYPVVPRNHANRKVRRLVARQKFQSLPTEWRQVLTPHVHLLSH
jgi:hypothetical protein